MCFGWLRGGGITRGLLGVVRVALLGHDKFVVAGNPQTVLSSVMQYDDFLLVAKKFRTGDRTFRHVSCVPPFLDVHKSISI